MIIFDSDLTHDIEELGYSVEQLPDTGSEVRFIKGAHKIELYYSDGEWFIFSESTNRMRSDAGYMSNESIGLSLKEIEIINDMIDKANKRLKETDNGG